MAVTPAPIATGPDARLNLIVPPLTFTLLPALNVGAASISSVPAPVLVSVAAVATAGFPVIDSRSLAAATVNRRARGECQPEQRSFAFRRRRWSPLCRRALATRSRRYPLRVYEPTPLKVSAFKLEPNR